MKRSTALAALFAVGALAGCSGSSQRDAAAMGVTAQPEPIMTLGAGDSLGRNIFANDVVLAARNRQNVEHAVVVENAE